MNTVWIPRRYPLTHQKKDLGVTFYTSLNFRQHIGNMIAKANSRVGLVKRAFSKLYPNSLKLLYKSLIRPILEYCSAAWYPLYKGDEQEIEKAQRRATKLVPHLSALSYPERLRELNLTTLHYWRKRTDMIQVYRIVHNINKIDLDVFSQRTTALLEDTNINSTNQEQTPKSEQIHSHIE